MPGTVSATAGACEVAGRIPGVAMTRTWGRGRPTFFAGAWTIAGPLLEKAGLGPSRRRLVGDLSGTVVEVGAGSGVTFGCYPLAVTRVVAVEPDPHLRARAERAARRATVPVVVVDAVAQTLPLGDGEADAVVFGLVLCSVPDVPGALAEARRVLRPGGELRVLEHVRATGRLGRVADRIAPAWSWLAGGCRPNQDTARLIEEAGFDVGLLRTRPFPPVVPIMPVLVGRAGMR